MNATSISTEIREFIADKISSGVIVNVDFLTTEIISGKDDIEGEDLPFYQTCAHTHVKKIVKACIGKYESKTVPDSQLVLPGFDHLQVAYTLERDNEIVLVPVNQCTVSELTQRADEYDVMAIGCHKHADEIRNYIRERSEAA